MSDIALNEARGGTQSLSLVRQQYSQPARPQARNDAAGRAGAVRRILSELSAALSAAKQQASGRGSVDPLAAARRTNVEHYEKTLLALSAPLLTTSQSVGKPDIAEAGADAQSNTCGASQSELCGQAAQRGQQPALRHPGSRHFME